MSKIKIYYDAKGRTLNVWFDDPKKEALTEEVGDGTVVSKDKAGKVIGFEKLYVDLPKLRISNPYQSSFLLPKLSK